MKTQEFEKSNYMRYLILGMIIILSGTILCCPSLIRLAEVTMSHEENSFAVLVPFLSLYILWTKRDAFHNIKLRYDAIGVPFLVIGLFLIIRIELYYLQIIGLIIFTAGLVIALLGKSIFKQVAFPLFLLFVMLPLPDSLYFNLANILRFITLGISEKIISFMGITFLREGNLIHMPNTVLDVQIKCSGIRYLIPYLILSLVYGELFQKTILRRFVIVFSSIIVAIVASTARLSFIFIMIYAYGPEINEYWPHLFISWAMFIIFMMAAVAVDQGLMTKSRQDNPAMKSEFQKTNGNKYPKMMEYINFRPKAYK